MKIDVQDALRNLWWVEAAACLAVLTGIFYLKPAADDLRLFELLGSLTALMITTRGIFEMRKYT